MNAQTLWWLVFLNQIKNFPCYASNPFILEEPELTATEGSCIKIKLQIMQSFRTNGAHWFWIKDPKWINPESRYSGTIIYSTDQTKRPVSPDFNNRVTFTCTHYTGETSFLKSQCNLWICDLKKADSGQYSFRFVGETKWMTESWTTLKVTYNPCPITFEQPPMVTENSRITLTCSTLRSCPSMPKIESLTSVSRPYETSAVTSRVTTVSFTASSIYDGKEFTCQTSDNKDKYLIRRTRIVVEYSPKWTSATIRPSRIKEGDTVTLTCFSKGRPELSFTWFHNEVEQFSGADWTIESIHSSQSGSYYCEAKNILGTRRSRTVNVDVLFPPTNVLLSMDNKVTEGQLVTITCSAESFPSSRFTIMRDSSNYQFSDWKSSQYNDYSNIFRYTFTASSTDEGVYICKAANSEGTVQSNQRKLVVKSIMPNEDAPKDVKVETWPGLTVEENTTFTLDCRARSYPAVTSVIWMKKINGRNKIIQGQQKTFFVKSASPSDSGLYSCTARNEIGAGNSLEVHIQVKYAPKHVTILKGEEQQSGGIRSVTLSCITQCYPEVRKYVWYKKTHEGDEEVSKSQNFTVNSDQKGEYYCLAENEINQKTSEPIKLLEDNRMMVVKISCFVCLLLLICVLIFFLYRCRRNKSNQQRITQPSSGSLAPSAPKSEKKHGAHLANDSLNYVSLQFGNHQKKPEEDVRVVYAKVSKAKASHEMERVADYENISSVHAAKLPDLYDSDSDTSEDEVEVNYSQVNFRPKRRQRRCSSSSDTSSEDETQYSQVKMGHHS